MLPGIALAVVIGVSPTLGALVAAAVMVGGVHVVRRHSPMPEDASIGLLFVGMLALAVVIVSAGATADVGDLHRVLFGSVTGLETADLWRQAVAAAIAVVGAFVFHRAFLVLTFDETQAALLGLRPRLTHLVLMGLVAMSVVASFEAVGSLLVFAFLVAPPTTAVLVVRRIPLVMATAVGVGSVAVVLGALISYHHDTAAGATMALVAVLFCFAVMGWGASARHLSRRGDRRGGRRSGRWRVASGSWCPASPRGCGRDSRTPPPVTGRPCPSRPNAPIRRTGVRSRH